MRITEVFAARAAEGHPTVSLEVFPPKTSHGEATVLETVSHLSGRPDFISVTYRGESGAATGTLASRIRETTGVEVVCHLTAVRSTRADIAATLARLEGWDLTNILALRGDGASDEPDDYPRAVDLIADLKTHADLCVGAATYPEGHVSSPLDHENIDHLRAKYDAGADFFVSQLFFDNDRFYRLLEDGRAAGVAAPIAAGIMPIMSTANIERLILFGASLPTRLIKIIHRYRDAPADLEKAGLDFAFAQIDDLLAHGVDGVHLYTMNRASVANQALTRYLV